ncbi:MAG: MoaD/ThiS family protein [Methylococcales bacterium]|jgi:sulfur-carrier protein|nr:MoaD/ThiS family protein [Methylococcales bacterium]MBT7408117.1 MoaD/ThiS family protein [Methylococcales bacterium]
MTIQIKLFANLKEIIGFSDKQIDASTAQTVNEAWNQITTIEMPASTLCSINMEYVKPDHTIKDGDEVAFFPPVTGG